MHGAAGHNDCPRRDVEPFAPAVKAKPAFKHFKDLLSLLVKVEWRPDERRDPSFDDREGPADISAVQAHRHLLASHRIEPVEVLGPADDCNLAFIGWGAHRTRDAGRCSNALSARSKATQECRNQPSHRVSVSPGPPGTKLLPAGPAAARAQLFTPPATNCSRSPCRREQMVGRPRGQPDRRRQIDTVIDYFRESREARARG
jgi:hypothetical protein